MNTKIFRTPTAKAILWSLAALVAEGLPILLNFLAALALKLDVGEVIHKYLESVGPVIIGFGILVVALCDVAIEEGSVHHLRKNVVQLALFLFAIYLLFLIQLLLPKLSPELVEKYETTNAKVSIAVATFTIVLAGIHKRDMFRRHMKG